MDQKSFNKTPSQDQANTGKGFAQKSGSNLDKVGEKSPQAGAGKVGQGISTTGHKIDRMDTKNK